MHRRELLGKMVGTYVAASALGRVAKAEETGFETRARSCLRSLMPSRQRIEDFITGAYGPRDTRPGEVLQYDPEMAKKIRKIHTQAALFATRNVVTWALMDTVVHWLNPRPLPYR
jgi:hypothetical protein